MYRYNKELSTYEKELGLSEDDFVWMYVSKEDEKDERQEEWQKQIELDGFSDKELWSLFTSISLFMYPRLERFKEMVNSYPSSLSSLEEWIDILDQISYAFKIALLEDKQTPTKEEWEKAQKGLKLFVEYFFTLWD